MCPGPLPDKLGSGVSLNSQSSANPGDQKTSVDSKKPKVRRELTPGGDASQLRMARRASRPAREEKKKELLERC